MGKWRKLPQMTLYAFDADFRDVMSEEKYNECIKKANERKRKGKK